MRSAPGHAPLSINAGEWVVWPPVSRSHRPQALAVGIRGVVIACDDWQHESNESRYRYPGQGFICYLGDFGDSNNGRPLAPTASADASVLDALLLRPAGVTLPVWAAAARRPQRGVFKRAEISGLQPALSTQARKCEGLDSLSIAYQSMWFFV